MPKEPFLNQVKQQAKRANKKVKCEKCLEEFSAMGFHNHVGSKSCEHSAFMLVARQVIEGTRKMLYANNKVPVNNVFIGACERRGLLEFIGAERVVTDYIPRGDPPYEAVERWWVWEWVTSLYVEYANSCKEPNPAYAELLELKALAPMDQELAISLLILKYADL